MKNFIEERVKQTLKEWPIPGLALAVVHKGDVLASGYGVKSKETGEPFNEQTLFQIASLSKAFTGLAVSQLVEAGKLQWETPLVSYLPTFRLKDPEATRGVTLRDLCSHRSGLPGVDKEEARRFWYHTDDSTDSLLERLSHVEPASSLRSHFGYTDIGYVVVGRVIERVTGAPFADYFKKEIFQPRGMDRSYTRYADWIGDSNLSSAYFLRRGRLDPIPPLNWDNMVAAGGVVTCAQDMARWLQSCLEPSTAQALTQRPQTLLEPEGFIAEYAKPVWDLYAHHQNILAYGYGWMIYMLNGRKVLFHPGLSDGMQVITAVVPEEQLAIAIFVNSAVHCGAVSLLNELLDHFLQERAMPWHQVARSALAEVDKYVQAETKKLYIPESKKRPHDLKIELYAGEYTSPAYGSIHVGRDLKVTLFSHEEGHLRHRSGNEFEIVEIPFPLGLPWFVEFQLAADHKTVQALKVAHFGVFHRL